MLSYIFVTFVIVFLLASAEAFVLTMLLDEEYKKHSLFFKYVIKRFYKDL